MKTVSKEIKKLDQKIKAKIELRIKQVQRLPRPMPPTPSDYRCLPPAFELPLPEDQLKKEERRQEKDLEKVRAKIKELQKERKNVDLVKSRLEIKIDQLQKQRRSQGDREELEHQKSEVQKLNRKLESIIQPLKYYLKGEEVREKRVVIGCNKVGNLKQEIRKHLGKYRIATVLCCAVHKLDVDALRLDPDEVDFTNVNHKYWEYTLT